MILRFGIRFFLTKISVLFFILATFPGFANPDIAFAKVETGLDRLAAEQFKPLLHKHIGLIANQTSVTSTGAFGPKLFKHTKGITLVALFAPEHGLKGNRLAGVTSDEIEHFESLPVYSLYGSTRRPTKKMLKGIDVLVFDLQDIGVRPYTYLSTMLEAMQAAADEHIEFMVLDRPNPLGGLRVEGNIRDSNLRSFVSAAPIPYIHGMTVGELAKMAVAESWISAKKLKLTVIEMQGWKRATLWPSTGLPWVAPSPNIPHFENAVGCAALGATGELGLLSIGIGGAFPFLVVGSNAVKADQVLHAAQASFPHGLQWRLDTFTAVVSGLTKKFSGIAMVLPNDLGHLGPLYEGQFQLLSLLMADSSIRAGFDAISTERILMFRKVTGTPFLSKALEAGQDVQPIIDRWSKDVATFMKQREKYLLYH